MSYTISGTKGFTDPMFMQEGCVAAPKNDGYSLGVTILLLLTPDQDVVRTVNSWRCALMRQDPRSPHLWGDLKFDSVWSDSSTVANSLAASHHRLAIALATTASKLMLMDSPRWSLGQARQYLMNAMDEGVPLAEFLSRHA